MLDPSDEATPPSPPPPRPPPRPPRLEPITPQEAERLILALIDRMNDTVTKFIVDEQLPYPFEIVEAALLQHLAYVKTAMVFEKATFFATRLAQQTAAKPTAAKPPTDERSIYG